MREVDDGVDKVGRVADAVVRAEHDLVEVRHDFKALTADEKNADSHKEDA